MEACVQDFWSWWPVTTEKMAETSSAENRWLASRPRLYRQCLLINIRGNHSTRLLLHDEQWGLKMKNHSAVCGNIFHFAFWFQFDTLKREFAANGHDRKPVDNRGILICEEGGSSSPLRPIYHLAWFAFTYTNEIFCLCVVLRLLFLVSGLSSFISGCGSISL